MPEQGDKLTQHWHTYGGLVKLNISGIVEWQLWRDAEPRAHGVVNVGGRLWKYFDEAAFYGQLGVGFPGGYGGIIFHYSIGAEYALSSVIRPSISFRRYFNTNGGAGQPTFFLAGISVRN
jgi:hypothetical protein